MLTRSPIRLKEKLSDFKIYFMTFFKEGSAGKRDKDSATKNAYCRV